jgi:hypothetical protein
LRQNLPEYGINPQVFGDCLRDGLRITGHHDHLDTLLMEAIDRGSRFLTNRVSDGEHRQRGVPLEHRNRRLSARCRTSDGRSERQIWSGVEFAKQSGATESKLSGSHNRLNTVTRNRPEPFALRNGKPTFLGALDDALCDCVFRVTLGCRT